MEVTNFIIIQVQVDDSFITLGLDFSAEEVLCQMDPSREGCPENPITPKTDCQGGGGAGGRVAIDYTTDHFTGTILSYGGRGYECGGAGTVLRKDTGSNAVRLVVDNNNICTPLNPRIEWDYLGDTNRGKNSFHTWLFDQDGSSHFHQFEVSIVTTVNLKFQRLFSFK